jgi:hypothetical protein
MTELSIFEIIKKEKKNINHINLISVNKLFCKYFLKYIIDIKNNLDEQLFNCNIEKINNMIFNIFWIIFLISFNTHITIFFLERASLLFIEYIKLSIKEEKKDKIINQAIIFTYNKTIGDASLEQIIDENNKNEFLNKNKYNKILKIRDNTYIFIKILNHILLKKNYDIEKNKKNNKSIINNLFHIYQKNKNYKKLDKYLFFKIDKILSENNIDKSLFIIRIIVDIIYELCQIENIDFVIEIIDNTIEQYETNNLFNNISYCTNEIQNRKIYINIKKNIYRFIT